MGWDDCGTERLLVESMSIIADYLGVRLPPLPSIFDISSAPLSGVEEESKDDSEEDYVDDFEETASEYSDPPMYESHLLLLRLTMHLDF